jgi:hypothetical protein
VPFPPPRKTDDSSIFQALWGFLMGRRTSTWLCSIGLLQQGLYIDVHRERDEL